MTLIDKVAKVLGDYPEVRFERRAEWIEVPPSTADGLLVSLSTENGTRIVHFDGWHEDFGSDQEALNCFMSGLTPSIRLFVTRRGDYDHKWNVEARNRDRWEACGTVGLLIFPFWRRKQVLLLQNRWLEKPKTAPEK